MPWMWALLRLPRFRGATHANGHDNRSRYCKVGFQVHGIDAEGKVVLGEVEAPDEASAKAAAAIQFGLDEIQRNRIMVQELA